jgi:hypothetical protein
MNPIIAKLQDSSAASLFNYHQVTLAYLYGSQARENSGPLSDVDVAVLFAPELEALTRGRYVLSLIHELGNLLQREDIQVVDLKNAPPLLRHRVYYDGRLLYCPDDKVRVNFETTALRDYVDTAPLRQLKEKYLQQRFARSTP